MGRPLFSSTLPQPVVVRVVDPHTPACEKWSAWNAFDPDSEDFFTGENVQYEAFLTPDQIAQQQQQSRASIGLLAGHINQEIIATHNAVLERSRQAGDVPLPELEPASSSDESASEDSGSGRSSPASGIPLTVPMASTDAPHLSDRVFPRTHTRFYPLGVSDEEHRLPSPWTQPSSAAILRQMQEERQREPTTREADMDIDAMPPLVSPLSSPTFTPTTPRPGHSPPVAVYSPLSPPPSVTPRYISWGPHPPLGSREVPNSPSPLGSMRSIQYLSTSPRSPQVLFRAQQ